MRWTDTPYVVLHTHPNHLVLDQMCREQLFSTGNLIGFHEVSTYSLQPEYLVRYPRRPLTVVLWGMADRYGVGPSLGVEVITLPAETSSSDVGHIVENKRLVWYTRYREPAEDDPGGFSTTGYWLGPGDRRPWDKPVAAPRG